MNQFRRFMYGRYGFDQFSQFMIWTSLIISVLGTLLGRREVIYISYIILAYTGYRILSKNINQRTKENFKFIKVINTLKGFLHKSTRTVKGSKTNKYYKCPHCRQTIRVPRGKGKICITCPKCKAEFVRKT